MITFAPKDPQKLLETEGGEWLEDAHPAVISDINCSRQLAEHKEELITGARARYNLGLLRQRQVKEANDRIERAHVDGLGRQVASFDPQVFLQLEKSWGRGWWRDRKRLLSFLRDNPQFAIRVNRGFTSGRNFSVRLDGLRKVNEGPSNGVPSATPATAGFAQGDKLVNSRGLEGKR